MLYTTQEIKNDLCQHIDKARFEHTIGVAYTAICLSMRYKYDLRKAETAGLLHDCAKNIPNDKKLEICRKKLIPITEVESNHPDLLHAKLGACLAREKYHIEDQEILDAILYHTTGRPNMTLLEKIIFVADYIEPTRYKATNLEELRALAFIDLDKCLLNILNDTMHFVKHKHPKSIDPMTEKTFLYYQGSLQKIY